MNRNDLKDLKKWFANYVNGFYTDDPAGNRIIRLKETHTGGVCRNIVMLGKALGLSHKEMVLAETMALFHDTGRFKQYAVYGTFNDKASVNHARLGIRQMAIHRVLSGFTTDEKRLITRAIAYHNAATLPENENSNHLFYMRLLRDADKLDIWQVFIDYYQARKKEPNSVIEIGLPDDPLCSPKIVDALHERRFAKIEDLKTLNDFKLLQISWVFDLNFTPSFQAVQRRRYIEQIAATLPDSEVITTAIDQARDYVKRFL